MSHSALLSQFVIGLISRNQLWSACAPLSEAELERVSLNARREGNFHKITEEYEELLLKTIEKEPAEYRYEFGRWTAARLATHLEQITGIKLSGSQVRRRLERKKYPATSCGGKRLACHLVGRTSGPPHQMDD